MITFDTFKPVLLENIDLEDTIYCFSLWEDTPNDDLKTSIKQFGILHPPILQQKNHNSYRIIAGRKRIIAAVDIALETQVPCRIIPADMKKSNIFSLILEEAATGRQLSITEQIVFLDKLADNLSEIDAVPFLEQLGYNSQEHILRDLLKLRSLSEPVLQSMHQNIISVKNARKMLRFSETDQHLIVELINDFRLGGSKQRKLIDLCSELIHRKNQPLEEVLSSFPLTKVQGQQENIPQQATALLSWLEDECFPLFTLAEKKFKRKVASLNLPSSMHVSHTPAFENDELILSLRLPDWESLKTVIYKIREVMPKKNNAM